MFLFIYFLWSEFHNQKDVNKQQETLKELSKKISEAPEITDYTGDLEEYYTACEEYWELNTRVHVSTTFSCNNVFT